MTFLMRETRYGRQINRFYVQNYLDLPRLCGWSQKHWQCLDGDSGAQFSRWDWWQGIRAQHPSTIKTSSLGWKVPPPSRGRRGGHLLDGAQRRDQAVRQPQGLCQERRGQTHGALVRGESAVCTWLCEYHDEIINLLSSSHIDKII